MNSSTNNDDSNHTEFAQTFDRIRQSAIFDGLPVEAQKLLAFICHRQTYAPHDIIFNHLLGLHVLQREIVEAAAG